MALRRIALGPAMFLPRRGFVAVPVLPAHRLPDGTVARGALIGRSGEALVAYANVCRHLAITLDVGDGDVLDTDGIHLRCHHHGAVFRPADGLCTVGPCQGMRLWPWSVEIDADGEASLIVGRTKIF
jgi:nitrite reductase/ring-hydroxylating ferredoxin subunit